MPAWKARRDQQHMAALISAAVSSSTISATIAKANSIVVRTTARESLQRSYAVADPQKRSPLRCRAAWGKVLARNCALGYCGPCFHFLSVMTHPEQLALPLLLLALLAAHAPANPQQATSNQGSEESHGVSPSDRSSILDSIEASRHAFEATPSGFTAHNPRFRLEAQLDGASALIRPAAGDWSFGVALRTFGFEGEMQQVARPQFGTCVEGQEIIYGWSTELSEWWVNDMRGLEHGFTVHERPARSPEGAASPLTLELEILGDLQPRVNESRTGLTLLSTAGAGVLSYDGLVAFDANGDGLAAWLEVDAQSLRICVDESQAVYPIVVDPVVQEAYVKASNTDAFDLFGFSIAASGDTVVVGAPFEGSNATGVNGDQGNDLAPRSGAAYVFVRSGPTWTQQAYLKASNTEDDDAFGWSVAISGETIVVGALGEMSNARGVNGDQSNNSLFAAGAAYVFVRSGSTWTQEAYLKASNPGLNDHFGESIAVSGDTVVVGAPREDSDADSVDGDQASNAAGNAGAAYVFARSGSSWTQAAYLKASNSDQNDRFGISVAVSGDTIVAGANRESSSALGPDGNQADNTAPRAGAAYVFTRSGSSWTQAAYLKASNTGSYDSFGEASAASGDIIAIGAPGEDIGFSSGAVYVFARSGLSWTQEALLRPTVTHEYLAFGESLAISGDLIAVGDWEDNSNTSGINSDPFPAPDGDRSGAAYAFVRAGSSWTQVAYIKASNAGLRDEFGQSVAASDDLIAVGAMRERGNGKGIGANQSSNHLSDAGAAYFFSGMGGVGTPSCSSTVNSTGAVSCLAGTGSASVGSNNLTLVATGLPAYVFGYFTTSTVQGFVMNPGGSEGNLCLGGSIGRYVGAGQIQQSDAAGRFSLLLDLANTPQPSGSVAISNGETWTFQAWHRDANAAGVTSNLTNGLEVVFTM